MPGLIDCHVHAMLSEVNIRQLESIPLTMMTVRAASLVRAMIDRGFTTVRDTGGADWGLRDGIAQGLLPGPRMFIAGRALGPTGGHSDARRRTDTGVGACKCCNAMSFCLEVVDGADAVRKAVREQLRQGVDQIKIMVSGGVASPYDPLDSRQFTLEEIGAAVEEAEAFGRYTQAHAYTPDAITRAVSKGVRTIEHGNLIDAPTARLMAERGAYLVPTLVAYDALKRRGPDYGLSSYSLAKNELVLHAGLRSLDIARAAGVKIGFGSDLLGQLQNDHCAEFMLRREAMSAPDIIRSATLVNAEIVRQLTDAGANLQLRGTGAPGFAEKTALDLATARGAPELIAILRSGAARGRP
jgi:imidazolonepropionase-like amidohydrolase